MIAGINFELHCLNMQYIPVSELLSLCLLHIWAMLFFSQWNLIILLYTQGCFAPRKRVLCGFACLRKNSTLYSHSLNAWEVTHATCHEMYNL